MGTFLRGLFACIACVCYAMGAATEEYAVIIAGGLFAIAYALCGGRTDNG